MYSSRESLHAGGEGSEGKDSGRLWAVDRMNTFNSVLASVQLKDTCRCRDRALEDGWEVARF